MVRRINAPIKPGDKSPEVANLQDALRLLLERNVIRPTASSTDPTVDELSKTIEQLNHERAQSLYGDTTRDLIAILQRQYRLEDGLGGAVEDRTANLINRLLRELGALDEAEPWIVKGTVYAAGKPRADVVVAAYDRDLRKNQPLGKSTQTDEAGAYRIEYQRSDFQLADRPERPGPWLIVEATAEGIPPAVFEKSQGVKPEETVDLVLDVAAASEWERILDAVWPLLEGQAEDGSRLPMAELREDDVEFLSAETALPPERLRLFVLAAKTAHEVQLIDAGSPSEKARRDVRRTKGSTSAAADDRQQLNLELIAFYGWFRDGQPQRFSDLIGRPTGELMASLERAISRGIIPSLRQELKDAISNSLESRRIDEALRPGAGRGPATLGDILATLPKRLSREKQRVVAGVLTDRAVTPDDLSRRLKERGFSDREVANVKVTLELGDLTMNHAPLVRQLQTLRAGGNDASIQYLSSQSPLDWLQLAYEHGAPTSVAGGPAAYAEHLEREVEASFPTAVFAARARSRQLELNDSALTTAAEFLSSHPDLELRDQNVRGYVESRDEELLGAGKEALVENLQRVQIAQKLSGSWRETGALLNAGFTSALEMVSHGRDSFVEALGKDIPPERADEIYTVATEIHDKTVALIGDLYAKKSPWVAEIFQSPRTKDDGEAEEDEHALDKYPNMRRLFGNLTTCLCEHCQSVLSPAAYLIDLMRFLDPPRGGTNITQQALHYLLLRRPDIAHIELTCKNTKTEIPYIDLVLEVLENAIGLPIEIPAPYEFDPEGDLSLTPLPDTVINALREVLQRSAVSVGERLQIESLTRSTFNRWSITDGARHWTLSHFPELLRTPRGVRLPAADAAQAATMLDQGELPNPAWVFGHGSEWDKNLPLKGTPLITTIEAGREWKMQYTRAVRVELQTTHLNGHLVLKTTDGHELDRAQHHFFLLQGLRIGLSLGQIAEPLVSRLPAHIGYQVTQVGNDFEVTSSGSITVLYQPQGLVIDSLTYQSSDARDDLKASPENRNPEAYRKLNEAVYPWTLPFDLCLEEVRVFLGRRGVSRRELMLLCNPVGDMTDDAIARETLGLSLAEWEIVSSPAIVSSAATRQPWDYWGLKESANRVTDLNDERAVSGTWLQVLAWASILLQQSGLEFRELLNVLQTRFVRKISPVLALSGDECNPSRMTLNNLEGEHLDRIHRLTRLWRKLGWSIFDLDLAISAVTNDAMGLNGATLRGLAQVRRLHELLGLPINAIASWWAPLTAGYRDHTSDRKPVLKSVYERLFLNPVIVNPPDPDFSLNDQATELARTTGALESKAPIIIAALGITQSELQALVSDLVARREVDLVAGRAGDPPSPSLTLKNLSSLYRHFSLAKSLRLSTGEYLRVRSLIGKNPFAGVLDALRFVETAQFIARSGFSADDLHYLMRYTINAGPTSHFTAAFATQTLSDIRTTLQSVRKETFGSAEPLADHFRKTLTRLGWYEELVEDAVNLFVPADRFEAQIEGDAAVTIPTSLNNRIVYRAQDRTLISSPALTTAEWNDLRRANSTIAEVTAAIDKLRAKVEAAGRFEVQIEGTAAVTVSIPTSLKSRILHRLQDRTLIGSLALTAAEWSDLRSANSASAEVTHAVDELRVKVEAFAAALPGRLHRMQSFELPTFMVEYDPQPPPLIPNDLSSRCYFDADAKRIVLSGWLTERQRVQLRDSLPAADAAIADELKRESDRYREPAETNRFISDVNRVKSFFSAGETSETRVGKVLEMLLPHLYRRALVEQLGRALDLDDSLVSELLLSRLNRRATLEAFLDTRFVDSDGRVLPTPGLFPSQSRALCKVHKAAFVCTRLKIELPELKWLPTASASQKTFEVLNLDELPAIDGDSAPSLEAWQQLVRLFGLRDRWPVGQSLIQRIMFFLNVQSPPVDAWLAQAFGLSPQDAADAIARLNLAWPADFLNPRKINELVELLLTAQRLGAKCSELFSLTEDVAPTANSPGRPGRIEATLARSLLRARYDEKTWPAQLKHIVDALRERQRNALVSYLITRPPEDAVSRGAWRSANDLYEHYLIDTEMSPCKVSTRILHAISAVQLFVQRCLMNLEDDVRPSAINVDRWKWMKNYRVWEANRKVFLYPENWIEPELRDDKSEIFEELEGQLLQDELDNGRAEDVLRNYVKQLESVSNLMVVGMYVDRSTNAQGAPTGETQVHIVARTLNRPSKFFYRRWIMSATSNYWTAWEHVPLDGVKTEHVLPFVFHGDPYIAWPEASQLASPAKSGQGQSSETNWRLQIAWLRRSNGQWSDRYLSEDVIEHPWVYGQDLNSTFTFRIRSDQPGGIQIECYAAERAKDGPNYELPEAGPRIQRTEYVPDNSGDPFLLNITVTGNVSAEYNDTANNNKKVYYPVQGAEVTFSLQPRLYNERPTSTDTAEVDRAKRGVQSDYPPPPSLDKAPSVLTDDEGSFTLTLTLAADGRGHGFFRPEVLSLPPRFELSVTWGGDTKTELFDYRASGDNRVYKEVRIYKGWLFIGDKPPDHMPGPFKPIRRFKLHTSEDAVVELASGDPLPTSPPGTFVYGSGLRANVETDKLAVPEPAGAVELWRKNPASQHLLFPAAPVNLVEFSPLLYYKSGHGSYFIRKQTTASDAGGAIGKYQVLLDGNSRMPDLRRAVALDGAPALFGFKQGTSPVVLDGHQATAAVDATASFMQPAIRFEPDESSSPYAGYNTELFFHVPFLIAKFLGANQRFEEAQQWFHFIFDPTTTDSTSGVERYWRYLPFRKYSQTKPIDELLKLLGDPAVDGDKRGVTQQIEIWSKNPFRPHAVARLRPRAYQFAVFFKYVSNLIEWGDHLFRQYTTESINEATQLYILASKLLGRRPQTVPRQTSPAPLTYARVAGKWDLFSNAWVELEANLPAVKRPVLFAPNETPRDRLTLQVALDKGTSAISSIGTLYFCVPRNEKMLEYWDKLDERLFNIRHCRNIEGVEQPVPLFQPPIDPALLVRAVAAGLDIGAVLAEANTPLPHYRFGVLAQKATELCNELKSLGGALLSALEKKDAEQLSLLRSGQELELLKRMRDVREQQLEEAKANVEALRQSEKLAAVRFAQYQRLLGKLGATIPEDDRADVEQTSTVNPAGVGESGEFSGLGLTKAEQDQILWSEIARAFSNVAAVHSIVAGILHGIPNVSAGSMVAQSEFGGSHLGNIMNAAAAFTGALERNASHQAGRVATLGQYQRRQDDWVFQSRLALKEAQQIRKQIIAAQIRQDIATKELANHDKQVKNAEETDRFMREKYTNRELYQWMVQQTSAVYFRSYQLARDVAKRAERAFRFELGVKDSNYIQFGYWDNLRKGLLAGEKLSLDLKRMEVAYLDQNKREYEITKHVSLLSIDPMALIMLRETGRCEIRVPEALFDLDYPGHYLRRIKSVGVTIPCVTGPYTGINCTLTLLNSRIRHATRLSGGYARDTGGDGDDRFTEGFGVMQSVVTTSAQNDTGLFETNLRDDRYLPFEGAGVDSEWGLELPSEIRQFDYGTISDVILHIHYTSRYGGPELKDAARALISQQIDEAEAAGMARLFSVRHEFPDAWAKFLNQTPGANQRYALTLDLREEHYPYWSKGRLNSVNRVDILARSTQKPVPNGMGVFENVDINNTDKKGTLTRDNSFGDLLRGQITTGLPAKPDERLALFFDNKAMADLWIAVTWSE